MSSSQNLEIVGDESADLPASTSAAIEVATTRAASEVQAAMVIAKKFPRDETKAFARIMQSCRRKSLADAAIYSFPRGGTTVEGPSIRLAEEMARCWGNIEFGITELEQRNGESTCMSYAWDLETNTRQTKIFTVSHVRISGSGVNKKRTVLDDPRDIYEMVANQGARRLRACILGVIPGDICEEAVAECNKTMAGPENTPIVDRARKMVSAFSDFGVTIAMIEKRLNHRIDATSEAELQTLRKIYKSISDGMATRESFFDLGEQTTRPPAPPKQVTGAAAAQQTDTPQAPANPEPPKGEAPPAEPDKKTRPKPPKPAEPAAPEPPVEEKKEEKKKEPRNSIADGEELTCKIQVDDIEAMMIGDKPSVRIEASGEFVGTIFHHGGAKADQANPEKLLVDSIWAIDRTLRVTLKGKLQRSGPVFAFVSQVGPA